ncbi:probable serine/threonine-protein kinase DDB_G0267686 [Panonychus citri]|uniref:probable serine/threonine-protein kinase DDB_G0267686 n=1 Tax=Panonychus citri TaxID=50023 RepID=UPI0023081D37|nr:probable serine/threonine-protein kinase DDB_G0267686 [Panonychus citri]
MWRNGKRFPCPDCHKTFATQVDLKAHLMRHITQHPYVCFACGKGFKYDHTLDFHIKSQHGAENGASSGGAGGSGNNNIGSGKNEQFNLKSLNRKSCKMKREVPDDKASLFGTSNVDGRRLVSQLQGGLSSPHDLIVNNHNNVPSNNNTTSSTSGKANSCDDRLVVNEISSDLRHHLSTNPLQLTGLNLSSGPVGLGLLEPSILNGLKFPIALSSYPSASSNSSQSSSKSNNNTVPIVPPPILPSSTVSSSLASSTLTSSLLTTTTTTPPSPSPLVSSLALSSSSSSSSTSSTPISSTNKEKLMNSSQMSLIDFGLQGDILSPRNLQIKSEKVLISILEGVHPTNEQLYSLYKCCLCGFAFPSLEPVSIHIQSMHSNNLNLTCDKCGATFKWKSELQLHEQLHKVMDQSINSINPSSNKCKSHLQLPQDSHHSHSNQQHQREQLLQHQQQHQHPQHQHQHYHQQKQQKQQQQQQQSRALVMPSFLQPNLVFMNPYLSGDQQLISRRQLHQHFQSIASMVSGISTMTTTTTSGPASTSGLGTGSGSVSSSSSSGSINGNGSGFLNVGEVVGGGGGKIREPIGDIEETAPGQFKCRYCEKTFDRIFSVHRHERVHTGYKPCICRVCGRGFSEKRNLRHHIIRFHSDGSGRELLKRVRKEKSISAASFLKKAAVRLLSNSSLEASAIGEEEIDKKQSDKNNSARDNEGRHEMAETREEKQSDERPRPRSRSDESTSAKQETERVAITLIITRLDQMQMENLMSKMVTKCVQFFHLLHRPHLLVVEKANQVKK